MSKKSNTQITQVEGKATNVKSGKSGKSGTSGKSGKAGTSGKSGTCPWLCNLVPINVPGPGAAQVVLHPRKDVFVLKVAKVGPNGDRRCKMELELVTPKGPEKKVPYRFDTRETQCEPDPPPCCCMKTKKKRN